MKPIVIYHKADFDGIFCREIARKFLPESELIGWDYGDPVPVIDSTDTPVYMLDISIPELMRRDYVVWIDHHKSAIEKFPGVYGYQIDGVAACRLAWQWFQIHQHNAQNERNEQMQVPLPGKQDYVDRVVCEPLAVRLAGEYDIWDKRDPDAELFQHGLRSQSLDSLWEILLQNQTPDQDGKSGLAEITVDALLDAGTAIQYAQTKQNESIIKSAGFTVEFAGLKFLACNHARYNSFLFTAGLTPEHDGCLGFAWRDGHWNVSLYHAPGKEHHDLSQIAVRYGGGGHRGACGFRVKSLPFLG